MHRILMDSNLLILHWGYMLGMDGFRRFCQGIDIVEITKIVEDYRDRRQSVGELVRMVWGKG
jgi:hypothetical protein